LSRGVGGELVEIGDVGGCAIGVTREQPVPDLALLFPVVDRTSLYERPPM
jgi:hypothetical protein